MNWTKVEPFAGAVHHGCLNCGGTAHVADLDSIVAAGFGDASITRDGKVVFQEMPDDEDFHTLREFEAQAKADPDHDWRFRLFMPLREAEYQRHGDDQWVLIHSGMGFA